jgi:uncharacterized protein YdbL (DUF1318 family)
MITRFLALAGAAVLAASLPAAITPAQTPAVNAARQAGLVGERYDGYLGLGAGASATLRSQVGAINIRRRTLYINLASSRRVSAQEVGITAGCSLLARVAVGEVYMLQDGVWRRRAAGQAAPVPDYCR